MAKEKIFRRTSWGPTYYSPEQIAKLDLLLSKHKSAESLGDVGQIQMTTAMGSIGVTPEQLAAILMQRPLRGESYLRLAYLKEKGGKPPVVMFHNSEGEIYFRVGLDRPLDLRERQILGPHCKNLGFSKEVVLFLFGEDAYKTGVVSKKEQEKLLAQVKTEEAKATSLEELGVEAKILSVLGNADINTVGDVLARTNGEGVSALLSIDGFGEKAAAHLSERMEAAGYPVPQSIS